ncbi:hypothetical protein HDU84_005859 [Entophlyctis sp. JEL0112]|nr:hypothetical protein HDU84_005859 [Entophlyctis sp. JEL0112]
MHSPTGEAADSHKPSNETVKQQQQQQPQQHDETIAVLRDQVRGLSTTIAEQEHAFAQKLALMNHEHITELEDLQRVHMIRLQIMHDEICVLRDDLATMTAKFEAANAQSEKAVTPRRDSKYDDDAAATDARIGALERAQAQVQRLETAVCERGAEIAVLTSIIEGLRLDNEALRDRASGCGACSGDPARGPGAAGTAVLGGLRRCESLGDLLETDLSLMRVGL